MISEKEFNAIKNHPRTAGDLVDRLIEIPADVCGIITQHHEQPDGSGFPRGLLAVQIAPLAAVFNVSHDMVEAYLELGDRFSLADFASKRFGTYTAGTFKKIAKILKAKCIVSEAAKAPKSEAS